MAGTLTVPASALRGKDLRHMTVAEVEAMAEQAGAKPPACAAAPRKGNAVKAVCRLPMAGRSYDTERMKSQLEVDYAAVLEREKMAGKILEWRYESITLNLADNTSYTPDFLVIAGDGHMELHETKGFWRPKDRIKLKTAARQHPWFIFLSVMRDKDGEWVFKRYGQGKRKK